MSDYLFLTLLVAGALWTIGRTIREAAWTVTPEAAEEGNKPQNTPGSLRG